MKKTKTAFNGYADKAQKRLVECATCNDGEMLYRLERCPTCQKKGRSDVDLARD